MDKLMIGYNPKGKSPVVKQLQKRIAQQTRERREQRQKRLMSLRQPHCGGLAFCWWKEHRGMG